MIIVIQGLLLVFVCSGLRISRSLVGFALAPPLPLSHSHRQRWLLTLLLARSLSSCCCCCCGDYGDKYSSSYCHECANQLLLLLLLLLLFLCAPCFFFFF